MSFSLFQPKSKADEPDKKADAKTVSPKQSLQKFTSTNYFVTENSLVYKSGQQLAAIELRHEGIQVMRDYYAEKYRSSIELLDNWRMITATLLDVIKQRPDKEVRHAFIFGTKTVHGSPFVYLREGGESAILCADPTPSTFYMSQAVDFRDKFKLPIYIILEARQSDHISCFLDALIFTREATAKDAEGNYVIPTLLSFLKTHANPLEHNKKLQANLYAVTKLPARLCRTVQMTQFNQAYNADQKSIVHVRKDGTQESFFTHKSRYQDMGVSINGVVKNADNYLRVKGLKVSMRIEIQFYLKQLKSIFKEAWTVEEESKFVKLAKEILRSGASPFSGVDEKNHGLLFDFANGVVAALEQKVALKMKDALTAATLKKQ